MAYGLTQREFRDFGIEAGSEAGSEDKERLSADKGLSQAGA
jgi:hypothetical protein